jgi:hypothetical protein
MIKEGRTEDAVMGAGFIGVVFIGVPAYDLRMTFGTLK